MKKVAVVLSGSGVYDGAEINEAVLTLLHIAKQGASYKCFAPDREQMHTVNHLTGEATDEKRNILVEAARIARGDIKPLSELSPADFDALVLPGGFGAAKNLCDFAVNGKDATIASDVKNTLASFSNAKKPIGYMCIAPALIPHIHPKDTKLTIGTDKETADAIEHVGGAHISCAVDDVVVDEKEKVVTTPAYMLAQSLVEADAGIEKLVTTLLSMTN